MYHQVNTQMGTTVEDTLDDSLKDDRGRRDTKRQAIVAEQSFLRVDHNKLF